MYLDLRPRTASDIRAVTEAVSKENYWRYRRPAPSESRRVDGVSNGTRRLCDLNWRKRVFKIRREEGAAPGSPDTMVFRCQDSFHPAKITKVGSVRV
jgi:hypothetical protein